MTPATGPKNAQTVPVAASRQTMRKTIIARNSGSGPPGTDVALADFGQLTNPPLKDVDTWNLLPQAQVTEISLTPVCPRWPRAGCLPPARAGGRPPIALPAPGGPGACRRTD